MEKRIYQLNQLAEKIKLFEDNSFSETQEYYPDALNTAMKDISDETDLYHLTIQYPALRPAVLKVFDAIMEKFMEHEFLWADDETQAGQSMAECFALNCIADIPMLTRFVNLCDIDHSCDVEEQVIRVWNKWGYCSQTCDLVASFMMRHQDGSCLPRSLDNQEQGITALMQNEEAANLMLASICHWLDSDVPWAQNYHRSEHAMKYEVVETLALLLAALLQIDSVEAEESAEKFLQFYLNKKIPEIKQIYIKSETPLQKGNAEQLLAAIMESMDELGQKVYEKSRENGLALNLDTKVGRAKPEKTRNCLLSIDGQKYNRIVHYVNGTDVPNNSVMKKFEGMDYSDVPKSFFANKLMPAITKWVENKVDTQAYVNLYGGRVEVMIGAMEASTGWIKAVIDRREYLKEWQNRFLDALDSREFTGWGCEEFGGNVNFWWIFGMADQLGTDLILEFLTAVNNHIKQEHPDHKPCVQTDIAPYMEAYYEAFQKEEPDRERAEGFLKILAQANIFHQLRNGKNLHFNKKAFDYANAILTEI